MPRLAITTGTSIFYSATWRPEGGFAQIHGYQGWIEAPFVESHHARVTYCEEGVCGKGIAERIEEFLTLTEPSVTKGLVEPSWEPVGRYSAELATLCVLLADEFGDDTTKFVGHYSDIDILCGPQGDPTYVAGRHLKAAIASLLGSDTGLTLREIAGATLNDTLRSFSDYLAGRPQEEGIDLVVTGGYKGFATIGGSFVREVTSAPRRALYLHEEADKLFKEDINGLKLDEVIVYRNSPSLG